MCFNQILFIGPAFTNKDKLGGSACVPNREGVGHVVDDYARHIHPFKYIACLKPEAGFLLSFWTFMIGAWKLFYYLLVDQEIKIVHVLDEIQEVGQRKSIKEYWLNDFLGKYLLCILIRIVFNKKFIYHINGDGISSYYATRRSFSKEIIKRLFSLTDMVLCASEEDLAFFKSNFNCKLVFIVSEGIDLQEDKIEHCIDGGLIKLLYLGGILAETPNEGTKEDEKLKSAQNCLQKSLCDLLNLMEENRGLYEGKVKLLIAGVETTKGFSGIRAGKLDYQLSVDNEVEAGSLITNRADYTQGLRKKYIYDLIHQRHLQDLVTYVDCNTSSLKSSLFKMANICLISSAYGRGHTRYLEAMNYGLPIIASARGSNCDMVLNGINGFLIPAEQKGGVCSAISHFLLHPTDAALMGAASKELVRKFDIQNVLLKLKFIYSNLLN